MIVIKTKLKKLPEKCNKCKYSYLSNERFCAISFYKGMNRVCNQVFNKEKHNWEYVRPDWCLLKDINNKEKETN